MLRHDIFIFYEKNLINKILKMEQEVYKHQTHGST